MVERLAIGRTSIGVTHRPVYHRQESRTPCALRAFRKVPGPITVRVDERPAKVQVLITPRSKHELIQALFPSRYDDALLMQPPTPLLHACLPRQKTEPRDHEYITKSYSY
jgi:hypothetical protein